MHVGPYTVRLGVTQESGNTVRWIEELQQTCLASMKYAKCSFYVPVHTPLVLAFSMNEEKARGELIRAQNYTISVQEGGVQFCDTFPRDEASFQLYGSGVAKTLFKGTEASLAAREETIEIEIQDQDRQRSIATFEFQHLEAHCAPSNHSHDGAHYSGESLALSTPTTSARERSDSMQRDSPPRHTPGESSDEGLVGGPNNCAIACSSTPKRQQTTIKSAPSTPSGRPRSTSIGSSLLPGFYTPQLSSRVKQLDSMVKSEPLQACPLKPTSPPQQLRKETQKKIDKLHGQLEGVRAETKALKNVLKDKELKAQKAHDRAVQRAHDDYNATRARNLETIEQLEAQLAEENTNLQWIQQIISDTAEVIELSDSENESAENEAQ